MNDAQTQEEWQPWHGESHPFSKLNEEAVRQIRSMHAKGFSYAELAHRFGVSAQTVKLVVKRQSWKHVV